MLGVLVYGFIVLITSNAMRLCPITTSPNFDANSDFHYPLEVYFRDRLNDSSIRTLKCADYTCPEQSIGCPLIEDNIRDSVVKTFGWSKSTSLCHLRSALRDRKTRIDVIVFGGSVTEGVSSTNCNSKEPFEYKRCAWPHYLEPWLRNTSHELTHVHVHNFGKMGTGSDFSAIKMSGYLRDARISKLTKDTIVLVDHSFNDYIFCRPFRLEAFEKGLESLIRQLIIMSNSTSDIPTIILFDSVLGHHNRCHSKVYRKVAEHYGLRIYSYVDAISSNSSISLQSDYRDFRTEPGRKDHHPLWHTHLLYADFIASTLQYEMDHCDSRFSLDGSKTPYVLPAPLFGNETRAVCNPNYEPLLRISYDDIMKNTTIGYFKVLRPNTWKVRVDRKGRGGIIAELDDTSNATAKNAKIEFYLNGTVAEIQAIMMRKTVLVQFAYMRSYENAGVAILSLCDEDIHPKMDSLWPDYHTYRYTTPIIFNMALQDSLCKGTRRHLDQLMMFSLRHSINEPHAGWEKANMTEFLHSRPRGTQMFKMVSMLVCLA